MKPNSQLILLLSVVFAKYSDSAKILGVFPFPSKSHHILGSALLKELAKRGHEVTMVSAFPLDKPLKNYKDVVLPNFDEDKDGTNYVFFFCNIYTGCSTYVMNSL